MRYFIPRRNRFAGRITHNDTIKMADLSSRGFQPLRRTPGFLNLLWGKTYRDLQITQWRDDVRCGFITKAEIYESVPEWLLLWVTSKLQDVPYDIEGKSTAMSISMYHMERQ